MEAPPLTSDSSQRSRASSEHRAQLSPASSKHRAQLRAAGISFSIERRSKPQTDREAGAPDGNGGASPPSGLPPPFPGGPPVVTIFSPPSLREAGRFTLLKNVFRNVFGMKNASASVRPPEPEVPSWLATYLQKNAQPEAGAEGSTFGDVGMENGASADSSRPREPTTAQEPARAEGETRERADDPASRRDTMLGGAGWEDIETGIESESSESARRMHLGGRGSVHSSRRPAVLWSWSRP